MAEAFDFAGGAVVAGADFIAMGGSESAWSTFELDGCLWELGLMWGDSGNVGR